MRPTKGGAVRIRIALTTVVAVTLIPSLFFTLFSSSSGASDGSRHSASSRTEHLGNKPSVAQARQAAQLASYANAVNAAQAAKYIQTMAFLQNVAFFNALAQQQVAQAAAQRAAAAAPAPAPGGGSDATSTNTPHWACIRAHESGGNYAVGNGGAYQFEFSTWHGLTGLPSPAQDYPPSVQDAAALKLYAERGWEPWTTRYVCGL
jgi:hypothetical protein